MMYELIPLVLLYAGSVCMAEVGASVEAQSDAVVQW